MEKFEIYDKKEIINCKVLLHKSYEINILDFVINNIANKLIDDGKINYPNASIIGIVYFNLLPIYLFHN